MKTKVIFLLDESGSIGSIKDQTISGFNEYVETIRGEDATLTLTKFNSMGVNVCYLNKSIKKVEYLTKDTFIPNGLTPLYDAIGETIQKLEDELKGKKKTRVLFIIMTDGEENASKEFDKEKIQKIMDEKEKDWTFVYLGANQDAWLEASKFGIKSVGATMSFATKDIKSTFSGLGRATRTFMRSEETKSDEFITKYMSKK